MNLNPIEGQQKETPTTRMNTIYSFTQKESTINTLNGPRAPNT